jgi:hypothetical protein
MHEGKQLRNATSRLSNCMRRGASLSRWAVTNCPVRSRSGCTGNTDRGCKLPGMKGVVPEAAIARDWRRLTDGLLLQAAQV